jgi:hypothetical protein
MAIVHDGVEFLVPYRYAGVIARKKRTGWWVVRIDADDPDSSTQVWVEGALPPEGFWFVAALFVLHRDRFVIAELRVFPGRGFQRITRRRDGTIKARVPPIGEWSRDLGVPDDMPTAGITKRLLNSVAFHKLALEAQTRLADVVADKPAVATFGDTLSLNEAAQRPGRRRRPDAYYLIWAERYVEALGRGSTKPNEDVAKRTRRHPTEVRDLVHEARIRGLLTRGERGKASGQLTPKALELRRKLDRAKRRKR